jgi:DNA-binding XRE family transcriptional regulator
MSKYPRTMPDNDIDPDQCRAARAYLGWGRKELANRAGVDEDTVYNFEARRVVRFKTIRTKPETRARFRRAFEDAGLRFDGNDMVMIWRGNRPCE